MRTIPISEVLREKMSPKRDSIVAIHKDNTIDEAIAIMNQQRVGAVMVMDGDNLIGMFSERDVVRSFERIKAGPDKVRVADIMSTVITVTTPEEDVWQALGTMTEKRHRHLPVKQNERVIGMVSIGDLVKIVIEEQDKTIQQLQSYITGDFA